MVMGKKELCIVHIGMPKTGSSTIQENLFYYGVDDKRVKYASLPDKNHGGPLLTMFIDNPEDFHYVKLSNIKDVASVNKKHKEMLVEGFRNFEKSIEIISGESLFHLSELGQKRNGVLLLKEFLYKYFHKVFIVAYVRKPYSLLPSVFQQLVKYHDIKNLNYHSIYHRYKNFNSYINVFGRDQVLLWEFESDDFPENDILLDFTTRLGLQPQRSKVKLVNESITKEAISILFTYHFHSDVKTDFGLRKSEIDYKLVDVLKGIGSNKFKFSGKVIKQVIEANSEDYEWIVSVMGDDFRETQENLSALGTESAHELMNYATRFIPNLIRLADYQTDDLKIDSTPQTVARLVNRIAVRLAK